MMPTARSEAAIRAAETRRRQKAKDTAKYNRENYFIYGPDDHLTSYSVGKYSLDEVLVDCALMVCDDEHPVQGVVVWLDGELVGAAKPGEDGVAVVTAFKGPYPGCRRVLVQP